MHRLDQLIDLGVLRGAWGLRGGVRIAPLSADADVLRSTRRWRLRPAGPPGGAELAGLPEGGESSELKVAMVRRQGLALVAKFEGLDDPEQAEALRGRIVAVARRDFPPPPKDRYYWIDLVGAEVVNRQGEVLGRVCGLRGNGVHDVLEIQPGSANTVSGGNSNSNGHGKPAAAQLLVPMVAQYVDAVESSAEGLVERIRVDWLAEWS